MRLVCGAFPQNYPVKRNSRVHLLRKQDTTFNCWLWKLLISWTLMEWFRYGNRSGESAITCVQTIVPMVLGRPAAEWNPVLTRTCCFAVPENLTHCATSPSTTHWRAQLMDACDMATRPPGSRWNVPVTKKSKVKSVVTDLQCWVQSVAKVHEDGPWLPKAFQQLLDTICKQVTWT